MIKFRLLLVAAAVFSLMIFGNFYYWLTTTPDAFNYSPTFLAVISTIVLIPAPFTFLSAMIMLAFSFLRVEEQNGMLVYDPKNLYWKVMNWIYDWNGPISLCKAFWTTVWSVFVASVVMGGGFMVWFVLGSNHVAEMGWTLLKVLGLLGGFAGFLFVFMTLVVRIDRGLKSSNKFVRYISITAGVILGVTVIATLVYLLVESGALLLIISALVLLFIADRLLKYLSTLPDDNVLIQMFYSLKNNLCPIIAPKSQND